MQSVIASQREMEKQAGIRPEAGMEFEAFVLNEMCQFTGAYDESGYLCGETGCGLCALYQLKQAGITHLKLVGRGNYVDHMEKDIRNLRKALEILDAAENEREFKCTLKRIVFPAGCSERCYYQ